MPPPPSTAAKPAWLSPIDPVKHLPVLLAVLALAAVSCQRIPPSVSIPGYEEKKAAEAKAEGRPLGAAEKAPEFFPSPDGE
jgi:hypothetical protein